MEVKIDMVKNGDKGLLNSQKVEDELKMKVTHDQKNCVTV